MQGIEDQNEDTQAPVEVEDAPSETVSAAPEQEAAAPEPAPASDEPFIPPVNTRQVSTEGAMGGTPMAKVEANPYKDELVIRPEGVPVRLRQEKKDDTFVRFEKNSLTTLVQAYDGDDYSEFALEDVIAIGQANYEGRAHLTVMLLGGSEIRLPASKTNAEELYKKWRSVRATQRR